MKGERKDRGASMTVFAPIITAIIGGAVAILAAVLIVGMAPDSDQSTQLPASDTEITYGDR